MKNLIQLAVVVTVIFKHLSFTCKDYIEVIDTVFDDLIVTRKPVVGLSDHSARCTFVFMPIHIGILVFGSFTFIQFCYIRMQSFYFFDTILLILIIIAAFSVIGISFAACTIFIVDSFVDIIICPYIVTQFPVQSCRHPQIELDCISGVVILYSFLSVNNGNSPLRTRRTDRKSNGHTYRLT